MSLQFSDPELSKEFSAIMNVDAVSSLSDFIETHRPLMESSDKLTSLRGEIALNKYCQTFFLPLIDRLAKLVQQLITEVAPDGRSISKKQLSKDDMVLYQAYHNQLIELGSKLQDSTTKTARLVKYAVEVEAIRSSKLDSLQLLSVLKQIPILIESTIKASILLVIDDIQKTVESQFVSDGHVKSLQRECKWFGRLRDLHVDELLQGVLEEVNVKLSSVSVTDAQNRDQTMEGMAQAELQNNLTSMLQSVPVSPSHEE